MNNSEPNTKPKAGGRLEPAKSFDRTLLVSAALLIAASIIVIFSASSVKAVSLTGDSAFYLYRHLMRVAIGIGLLIFFMRIRYERIKFFGAPLLLISLAFLVVLAIPGLVDPVKGSRRFISILGQSMQPSDFAKLALILFLSNWIAKEGEEVMSFPNYVKRLLLVGLTGGLIVSQPDLSTGTLITLTGLFILFIGGARIGHLLLTAAAGIPVALKFALTHTYQFKRIESWWGGLFNPDLLSHQVRQSLIALGDGGLTGVGIGNSMQKKYFLPEPFTDFIFSIWGEETGFIGAAFIVLIFMAIAFRGVQIARTAPDKFGFLAAAGCTFAITVYALANLMVVTGLTPVSGLPLPIITYGGSSLIVTMCMLGIMLNISRHCKS